MFFVIFTDFKEVGISKDGSNILDKLLDEKCFHQIKTLFEKKCIEEAYCVEPNLENYKNFWKGSYENDKIMIASDLNIRIDENFNTNEIEKLMKTQYDFLYKEDLSFYITSPKYSNYLLNNVDNDMSLKTCINNSKSIFKIDTVI